MRGQACPPSREISACWWAWRFAPLPTLCFWRVYSNETISTQFAPLPVGYFPISFSAPESLSIAYDEIVSDFSPETTTYRPLGSMAKPRGCFSVGVLLTYVNLPLAGSTRNAPSVLEV